MVIEEFANRIKQVGVLYVDVYPYFIDPTGNITFLVLKRRDDVQLPGSWQAISGKIWQNEKIRHAFIRQVKDKTGLLPVELFKIDNVNVFYDDYYDTMVPAAACRLESQRVTLDPSLHTEYRWIRADEAALLLVWPNQLKNINQIREAVASSSFSLFHKLSIS